jgi:hypothetical protein
LRYYSTGEQLSIISTTTLIYYLIRLTGSEEEENIEEELIAIEKFEEQYQAFTDDSRVHVVEDDVEPIQRLLRHKYNKFKYNSKDFLMRNHIHTKKSKSKKTKEIFKSTTKPSTYKSNNYNSPRVVITLKQSPDRKSLIRTPDEALIRTSPARDISRSRASKILHKTSDPMKTSSGAADNGSANPSRASSILKDIASRKKGNKKE